MFDSIAELSPTAVTILTALWSDRKGRRAVSAIATSGLAVIGYIVFLTCRGRKARYASLFLSITGVYGVSPPVPKTPLAPADASRRLPRRCRHGSPTIQLLITARQQL